jgi:hypothetical protein
VSRHRVASCSAGTTLRPHATSETMVECNIYVSARVADLRAANGIAMAGILVTLSAFVMPYKSHQARGYLHFLGRKAKLGKTKRQRSRSRRLANPQNRVLA